VPVIVLTVAITLVSVVVGNSEYRAVFPWAAILPVLTGKYPAEFPTFAPIVSILTTSVIGTVGSFIALGRMDIS
jgi:bacitracin transport system permease protein